MIEEVIEQTETFEYIPPIEVNISDKEDWTLVDLESFNGKEVYCQNLGAFPISVEKHCAVAPETEGRCLTAYQGFTFNVIKGLDLYAKSPSGNSRVRIEAV